MNFKDRVLHAYTNKKMKEEINETRAAEKFYEKAILALKDHFGLSNEEIKPF